MINGDTIYTDDVKQIGIIGGGTAGYLTALSLKKIKSDIEVSLIESSQIPVIGVGEATTPILLKLLHEILEIDIQEFHSSTHPTWKLGIKYEWGKPGSYYFNNPFGRLDSLLALKTTGKINDSSLISTLMDKNRTILFNGAKDEEVKMAHYPDAFAYHLENRNFVQYLKNLAEKFQVKYLDRKIENVSRQGNQIEYLITDQGEKLEFDLYVDCSGFYSVLCNNETNPFISFESSLFTDSAVIGVEPHENEINVYTTAKTMNCGWQWEIPVEESNHVGYVFSSKHCSEDEARDEMLKAKPNLELKDGIKRFKPGRRQKFWDGNVISIGNAYGFVEPLESTGIHMIASEIMELIHKLQKDVITPEVKDQINATIGNQWDIIRWYLAIHFKYNKKLDTPFWIDCREKVDVSGVQDYLDFYKANGPVTIQKNTAVFDKINKDNIFSAYGFDLFMLAQDVPTEFAFDNFTEEEIKSFKMQVLINNHLSEKALSMSESLKAVINTPDLLRLNGWFN